MQEEIENKSITLIINCTKFTGRVLKSAISKYLAHRSAKHREKKMDRKARRRERQTGTVVHRGKQTVKQLVAQNQGVSTMDVADKDMRDFQRVTRKYGVDYAVKRSKGEPDKYLVFFKARDNDALIAAFNEFTQKREYKKEHPSILKRLAKSMAQSVQKIPDKVRNKRQEIDR